MFKKCVWGQKKDRNLILKNISIGAFTCRVMCFGHYCHSDKHTHSGRTRSSTCCCDLWFPDNSSKDNLYQCLQQEPVAQDWGMGGFRGQMFWFVSQSCCDSDWSNGMMDGIREPEWKSEFGGEAENRVAMNWKNGMKKSLNDKRAKAQMKCGGGQEPETWRREWEEDKCSDCVGILCLWHLTSRHLL